MNDDELLKFSAQMAAADNRTRGGAMGCIIGILREQGTTREQVHAFVDKLWSMADHMPSPQEYVADAINAQGLFNVDEDRIDWQLTGILVRANRDGKVGDYDIAHLDRASLTRFLTSRPEIALSTALYLLGHDVA